MTDDAFAERLEKAIGAALKKKYRCRQCNQPIMYVRWRNRWGWKHQDKTISHEVQR